MTVVSVRHTLRISVIVALVILAGATGAHAATLRQECVPTSIFPTQLANPKFPMGAQGGRFEITFTLSDGCAWGVGSMPPFITLVSGAGGSGSGRIVIDVAPNPADFRFGSFTITFGGVVPFVYPFHVTQSGCLWVLARPDYADAFPGYQRQHSVDAAGGLRYLKVHPSSSVCSWPAASQVPWITTTSGGVGTGPGFVGYRVEPNTSGMPREGTITVGYLTFTVRQSHRWDEDMNGDGHVDLLWHHQVSGQIAAWLMNETHLIDGRLLDPGVVADTAWKVVGTGDFTKDAQPEIIWQNDDGQVAFWWMNFTSRISGGLFVHQMLPQDPDWRVRAVADLNSDGHQDLIWQHRTTGQLRAWIMFGTNHVFDATFSPFDVPDTDWQIVGAADFNGDSQVDLLWQNQANGLIAVWLLEWSRSGLSIEPQFRQVRGLLLNPGQVPDTNWKIRGAADIDRDGQPDLIWHHQTSGLISTWLMNGLTMREGTLFSPGQVADTNWVIVGPR